jgi:hypothetical protein
MPLRAAKAAERNDQPGGMTRRGGNALKRQTIVRGLRIACRTISVSLRDTGPQDRLDRKRRVTS